MSLSVQALTILHMIGAGLFIGVGYDTYARLRYKRSRWLTFVQDLSFWFVCLAVIFLWLLYVNEGQVRFYIFLALLCGFATYKALLQKVYSQVLEAVLRFIEVCARIVKRLFDLLIIKPLKLLIAALVAVAIGFATGIVYLARLFYRGLSFILKPLWRMVQGMFLKLWQGIKRRKKTIQADENLSNEAKREAYMRELSQKNKRIKKGILHWIKNIFSR